MNTLSNNQVTSIQDTDNTEKNPIAAYPSGTLGLNTSSNDKAWELAKDCVNYPVSLRALYIPDEGDFIPAAGDTNTGRETEFYGVVVDRNRVGDKSTISVVTDTYGTLDTKSVYEDLRTDLEEIGVDYSLKNIYVSGNGGAQALNITIDGMTDAIDEIEMLLTLQTSIDGTKKHHMRLSAWNAITKQELLGINGGAMNISSRHTKTIGERHGAFSVILIKLIGEWEETIIPMITLMNDMEFDYNDAMNILREILEGASIPERHVEKAVNSFERNSNKMTFLDVMTGASYYFNDAMENRQERLNSFRDKIAKQTEKTLHKLI